MLTARYVLVDVKVTPNSVDHPSDIRCEPVDDDHIENVHVPERVVEPGQLVERARRPEAAEQDDVARPWRQQVREHVPVGGASAGRGQRGLGEVLSSRARRLPAVLGQQAADVGREHGLLVTVLQRAQEPARHAVIRRLGPIRRHDHHALAQRRRSLLQYRDEVADRSRRRVVH